jgi:hypothetical protein
VEPQVTSEPLRCIGDTPVIFRGTDSDKFVFSFMPKSYEWTEGVVIKITEKVVNISEEFTLQLGTRRETVDNISRNTPRISLDADLGGVDPATLAMKYIWSAKFIEDKLKSSFQNDVIPNYGEWFKTAQRLKSVRIYHESGNLHYEGRVINGLYEGWGKLYHTNGALEYEGKFYKGKKYMKSAKTYWPNGGEKIVGELFGDLMVGDCHENHEDGSLKCIGNYESHGAFSGLHGRN